MNILDFNSLSLFINVIIFAIAGVAVYSAGTKLTKVADSFSEETGIGRAFVGLLLLGGITSLPEVATTITASLEGNAGMAVSNILGGVSMQVTILAVVDFWQRKTPLSNSSSTVSVIIQGGILVSLLAIAGAFMLIPSFSIFHIGLSSLFILCTFLFSIYIVHKFNEQHWFSYQRNSTDSLKQSIDALNKYMEVNDEKTRRSDQTGNITVAAFLRRSGIQLAVLSLIILAAGYFVVKTSEAIAEETGIGKNFAGLVLVAITTSLPEISTTIGAVRLKRYDMAFSNIFGTNLFDVSLIFLADLFYLDGAVFDALDQFALIAVFLCILLTSIYLIGILSKSKKQVLGVGYDSLCILVTYLLGILVLFYTKSPG